MTTASAPRRPMAAGMWFGLAVLVGVPAPATAETGDGTAQPDPGASASKGDTVHWTLGAGVVLAPPFEGGDDHEAQPVPLVDVRYGRFFASTGDGIGFNILETPAFTAGAGVDWMPGYDRDDVPDGIDEVDDEVGARLFVSTRFQGLVATLAATQAVTETDRGLLIDADLAYPIHAGGRLTVTPSVGATWANEKYMNGYFGVDSSEAAASGLRRYQPSNGLKDITVRVSAGYRITDSVTAVGSVGVTRLLGEAADSPLVEEETYPIALIGLSYTF